MQRSNTPQRRAALLFVALTLAAVTLVCGAFLLLDVQLPEWFVVVGRWLPALVTLLVLRLVPLPGGVARWWALRPGGWRRLVVGGLVTVAVLVAAYAVTALVIGALGLAESQVWAVLAPSLLLLVPMVLVLSLSTLGEEAAWRGFLQQTLSDLGFWRASAIVAAVWVVFHVPLHGVMALQGTLPWVVAAVSTVGVFPLGLFLSAAVARFGSVWPAVFGHAAPLTALNLLVGVDELPASTHWAVAGVTAVVLVGAAVALAPRSPAPRAAEEPVRAG